MRDFQGDEGVLECVATIRDLAREHPIREVVYDPWRFGQAAIELERQGVPVVQFPQIDARMISASDQLRQAIVEQRLVHPDDPQLNEHAFRAIARHSRRGWRIDKTNRSDQIDAVIAMCMAVERAEHQPEPVRFLGWL
ncbi:MAG: terminase large subunit [Actinomycetota bacterium]|nr:terminase large subunit [Actinomycetota bacterium]